MDTEKNKKRNFSFKALGAVAIISIVLFSFFNISIGVNRTHAQTIAPSEVAAHNSQSDCWIIVNSKVYNVTNYLPMHPGGVGAILPLCGTDATVAFVGKHGSSASANSVLASYYVGDVGTNPTPTPTPIPSPSPSPSPSASPSPSTTPDPSPSPSPLPTISPTPTPIPSPSPVPIGDDEDDKNECAQSSVPNTPLVLIGDEDNDCDQHSDLNHEEDKDNREEDEDFIELEHDKSLKRYNGENGLKISTNLRATEENGKIDEKD